LLDVEQVFGARIINSSLEKELYEIKPQPLAGIVGEYINENRVVNTTGRLKKSIQPT